MFRLVSVVLMCLVMLPSHGQAQEKGYQVTTPSGWTANFSGGLDVYLPPEGSQAGASILLLPLQPSMGDLAQQAQVTLKSIETSMKLTNPRFLPLKREKSGDAELVYLGATFSSASGDVYVLFMTRAEKNTVGALLFLATSQDAVSRYGGTAGMMFTGMRLTGQTEQNQQTQHQIQTSPQQQPNRGTPPAEGPAIVHTSQNAPTLDVTMQDLVGIWVGETALRRESFTFGTRTDIAGNTYNTLTYSFSSPLGAGGQYLKVRADGTYEFFHNFMFMSCGHIKQHSGRLIVQNGRLVMQATAGHETQGPLKGGSCEAFERDTLPPPDTYSVEVTPFDTAFGYPTYRLRLVSVVNNGNFHVLDRLEARPQPATAPPMTRDFQPGNTQPGSDLQGTWTSPNDTPVDFTVNSPIDGKYHAVLRLFAGGRYELVSRRPDVIYTPVCSKQVTLVEHGIAEFGGKMHPGDNTQESGAMTLKPQSSQLIAEVRNCGPDNSFATYNLASGPRYMRWYLKMQRPVMAGPLAGDKLNVVCPDVYERANTGAWTFLVCPEKAGQEYSGYMRR